MIMDAMQKFVRERAALIDKYQMELERQKREQWQNSPTRMTWDEYQEWKKKEEEKKAKNDEKEENEKEESEKKEVEIEEVEKEEVEKEEVEKEEGKKKTQDEIEETEKCEAENKVEVKYNYNYIKPKKKYDPRIGKIIDQITLRRIFAADSSWQYKLR